LTPHQCRPAHLMVKYFVPLLSSRHATRAPAIGNCRFPARPPLPCGSLLLRLAERLWEGNEGMVWACVAGGAVGLLLGLWLRVPALIAASGVTAALCLLIAPLTELGPPSTAGMILALLSVLQVGYLAGLLVSCA
jgi:hypothetical protein